jgi:hypothetical protein
VNQITPAPPPNAHTTTGDVEKPPPPPNNKTNRRILNRTKPTPSNSRPPQKQDETTIKQLETEDIEQIGPKQRETRLKPPPTRRNNKTAA